MTARRLAAILAADVVGFSRLIGADEAGTLARLRTLRREIVDPLMTEHGGRIFKTTGDGLLAEFPSAVQALRCAIATQDHLRADPAALQLRIGLHQGDVVIEGDDLLGDGVNIAARIEPLAEPGGICISARVREDAAGKILLEVDDLGTPELKNIAQPVRVFRVVLGAPESPALPLPEKPSLVVLPFQNMSGDPEQEYFADGMVEDITSALSRIGGLMVIARNSAFTYKGRAVDVRQVGRELGVRYVLEGSVRRVGGRVRITCQLIEAATGAHVWTDRFDDDLQDVFALQDRVTESVAGAIEPSLLRAEFARAAAKPTENLDAYDLYLKALQQHNYLFTEPANIEARRLLRQAITIDPGFARAKALAAVGVHRALMLGLVSSGGPEYAEAIAMARAALADAPDDPTVLRLAGFAVAYLARDLEAGRAAIDRSILLNPNPAATFYLSGSVHSFLGNVDIARDHITRAMRLSPLDPGLHMMQSSLASVLALSDPPEASLGLEIVRKALATSPNYVLHLQAKIECLMVLGRLDEARETARHLMTHWPKSSISAWRARWPHRKEVADAALARYRAAGIPE